MHGAMASISQLVEHALRKRTVVGLIPTGGFSELRGRRTMMTRSPCTAGHDAPSEKLLNTTRQRLDIPWTKKKLQWIASAPHMSP